MVGTDTERVLKTFYKQSFSLIFSSIIYLLLLQALPFLVSSEDETKQRDRQIDMQMEKLRRRQRDRGRQRDKEGDRVG
jgi:hypothetical protein